MRMIISLALELTNNQELAFYLEMHCFWIKELPDRWSSEVTTAFRSYRTVGPPKLPFHSKLSLRFAPLEVIAASLLGVIVAYWPLDVTLDILFTCVELSSE